MTTREIVGTWAMVAALAWGAGLAAGVPQPDVVLYGTVTVDGIPATAADELEIRAVVADTGETVGEYTLGAVAAAGDRYVLRICMEAEVGGPRSTGAAIAGDLIEIYVRSDDGAELLATTRPELTDDDSGTATELDLVAAAPCESIPSFSCEVGDDDTVLLSWTLGSAHEGVRIIGPDGAILSEYIDGEVEATADPGPGTFTYTAEAICAGDVVAEGVGCTVIIDEPPECLGVSDLECFAIDESVLISWDNEGDYDAITVERNGEVVADLDPDEDSFIETPGAGCFVYEVVIECGSEIVASTCEEELCFEGCEPVVDLECTPVGTSTVLSWDNSSDYDALEIRRDGELLAELDGDEDSFVDGEVESSFHEYEVVGTCDDEESLASSCEADFCLAVEDLTCDAEAGSVVLTWTNPVVASDGIEIRRDGDTIASLSGEVDSFEDVEPGTGSIEYEVATLCEGTELAEVCAVEIDSDGPEFLRGDSDASGSVSGLADGLFLLNWQFIDGDAPPCMDAADVDDSGAVSGLVDALSLLEWQFGDGLGPPAPGPLTCGSDSTDDDLDCETTSRTCE